MAYVGWYSLGGQEIVNAARAERYVDNAMPNFGLRKCVDTSGLASALGEEYGSPLADKAPWFDPTNPVTAEFYGVYPLDVQGIEDSVRSVSSSEALGDGSVFSRPRQTGRDIRFNVLLLGSCEAALDAGQQWLNRALEGSCGAISGCDQDDLCFFSDAPPRADWLNCPAVPLDTSREDNVPEQTWFASGDADVFTTNGGVAVYPNEPGAYGYRIVSGLVPGATYRLSAGVDLASRAALIELPGIGLLPIDHSLPDGQETPYNLDFVATGTSVMVKVIPVLEFGPIPSNGNVRTTPLRMVRVSPNGSVYHSEFRPDGTASAGWTVVGATDFGLYGSSLQVYWHRVMNENPGVVQRTLRGFTVGRRYRMSMIYNGITDNSLRLDAVSVNGVSQAITYHDADPSNRGATIDFVADSSVETIVLNFVSFGIPPVQGTVEIDVIDIIDITDQTDVLRSQVALPSGAEGLVRTLYSVTATQGAVTAEDFGKDCGAMRRVTFALRAGVPDVFGPQRRVGTLLGGSTLVVPDYTTCADGIEQRVNYFQNPSLELNTTGFSTASGGWALSRVIPSGSFSAAFGNYALSLTRSGAPGSDTGTISYTQTITPDFPIIKDGTYTLSFYTQLQFVNSNPRGTQVLPVDVVATLTSGSDTQTISTEAMVPNGYGVHPIDWQSPWTRVSITFTNNLGANLTQFGFSASVAPGGTGSIYLDGLMLENSTSPGPYFDGATNGGVWTGAVSLSVSTLTPALFDPTIDPNCPQPPLPPQPPSIDDACIENPGIWRRYVMPVSRQNIPGFGSAVPIITITTGDVAVRQARVRFYANPLLVDIGELPPCDFCGEVQVSYIPPGARFVIDGVRRIGSVETGSSGETPASHLLYGSSNGGPVDWPELSCGIDYYAVVDMDATDDTSGVDFSLDLGVMI